MSEERLKVLLADDEYWIKENLRTLIDWNAFGLELLPMAEDGEDALRKMESAPADIVITDINMPYVSGVELMRRLRERWPQTVILVLSGYSDFEYVHQALLAGALDYILKPINRSKLVEVLQRAMEQVFARTRERRQQAESQSRLKMAASMVTDRDFSQWLHDAKHQERLQHVEAQLFDYEAAFSAYRVVLIKLAAPAKQAQGMPHGAAEAAYAVKTAIAELDDNENRIVIHDLYHTTHFLLITELDQAELRSRLPAKMQQLRAMAGTPPRAMVSRSYFSLRDLRRAYDDTRRALMAMPCAGVQDVGFADEMETVDMQQRLSSDLLHRMEHAVRTQQREAFERLVEQSGLYDCLNNGWTMMETLHCVNRIAWVVRRHAEEQMTPVQLMGMDNLMEMLLDCVDRMAFAELRSLMAQLLDECFVAEPPHQTDTMRDVVARAKQYVDTHYSEPLSLSLLAERFSVDDSYLSRMFKQQVGLNLMLYVAGVRVAQAKQLLKQKELSITDVAQLVGYDDYAYFSRVFKKMEGKSPRAYREEETP